MNAFELFHSDGRTAGVWCCGKCRHVASSEDTAQQCCAPYRCRVCDVETKHLWLICDPCRAAKTEKANAKTWAAAEPAPPDYSGPYYVEYCGDFVLDQDMGIWAALNGVDPEDMPDRIYACTPIRPTTDASRVIEAATEEMHERAYDEADVRELQGLLDAYWERQGITSWEPNFKLKIVLEKEGE